LWSSYFFDADALLVACHRGLGFWRGFALHPVADPTDDDREEKPG
jgi:hypothetical protein